MKALPRSAYEEAQRYFEAALSALIKLPHERARIEQEIDLRFNMRSPLFLLGRHDEWGEWIRGAELLAQEIDDDASLCNVFNYLSNFNWIRGQHRRAIELGEKALNLAEKAGYFSCQVATMLHLGFYFFSVGDYPKQIEVHQDVRRRLTGEPALQRHGLAGLPAALSRSLLTLGMAELGDFEKIEEIGLEGLEMAKKAENAMSLILGRDLLAIGYLRRGKVERALPLLEKAHELCRSYEMKPFYSFTAGSLGYAYLLANEPKRALTILEEGARADNLQASIFIVHPVTVLADAYRFVGETALATETISRALKIAKEREERGFEAWAMLVMAAIQADAGRLEEAIQWYGRALQQASDLLMRPLIAHCHKGLGDTYLRLGNEKEAQIKNKAALEIYRTLGMTYWLQS